MLRDLWIFFTQSVRTAIDSSCDFTIAHFALAEDAMTDVLSEALVLAMKSDSAVTSSTIVDILSFLPKDPVFMTLAKLAFSSNERVHLSSISAIQQVLGAFLLCDSDFAANVSIRPHEHFKQLTLLLTALHRRILQCHGAIGFS
jgi:hypothetical protein